MSELKKVWVTDTRHPNKPAFLYAEHLLKFSKNLKRASKPKPGKQAKVTEPEVTPEEEASQQGTATVEEPATTRSNSGNKKNR